jgi:hypothetical protein
MPSQANGVPIRVTFTVNIGVGLFPPNASTPACHTVDAFVTSDFQTTDTGSPDGEVRAHLPLIEHDVAHVRWYVYVPPSGGIPPLPSISECLSIVPVSGT